MVPEAKFAHCLAHRQCVLMRLQQGRPGPVSPAAKESPRCPKPDSVGSRNAQLSCLAIFCVFSQGSTYSGDDEH